MERKDLLIGENVTVEGKIFLGYPYDESWPGPFTIWAVLKDTSKYAETYGYIFLYENGEFIFCNSPRNYIEACNGWENGKQYRITGILRKGILKKEDTSRGGRRAYYSFIDAQGVEEALKELKIINENQTSST